jgi:tetratricopeptide (TPR) repeat protein
VAQQITRALDYAHTNGVVHGDLKPKNILMAGDSIRVSDFGLGRLEGGRALFNLDVPPTLAATQYLAPEQLAGHPIDARTDLYALGVILYEMFTGTAPFTEEENGPVEAAHRQPPPRQLNPKISLPLEHLILKLLDKDPDKRYASARPVGHIFSSMAESTSRDSYPESYYPIERIPTLVGRAAELSKLQQLWELAQSGRGQVVLVSGEMGLGKTRLVQELACRLNQAVVFTGHCHKAEGRPAYEPFVDALESYFNSATAPPHMPPLWQQLNQLLPEVRLLPTQFIPPAAAPNPAAPIDLWSAVAELTRQHPWLIILDDLQWADTSTLRLLDCLVQQTPQLSVLVVGVYESATRNPALLPLIERLGQQPNFTALNLPPLTEAETRHMLESIWDNTVPVDLSTAIFNRTRGNPLFAETIVYSLIDEGVVNWRDKKWHFGPMLETGLPQHLPEAISRRLGLLSRETQSLLHQAAILGPEFYFEDLSELSDLSKWDALESINIALERHLLKNAMGEQPLRFSHPIIQEVLYNGLSYLKQRLLHREAGEAMDRREPHVSVWNAGELAHHFFDAGELERGLVYSIQAARQSEAVFANSNAVFWYSRALDAIDQLDMDNVTQMQRFELLLARERLYHTQGNRSQQMVDLATLQNLSQQINDPHKQAIVHTRQAAYEFAISNPAEAATEAQTGLIAARQAGDPALESENLIQLAAIALHYGQFDATREHLYLARKNLSEEQFPLTEARRLNGLGQLYQLLSNYIESQQYFRQAMEIGRQMGDRFGQAIYLSNLAEVCRQRGQYTPALTQQQQALAITQLTACRRHEALCLNRLTAIYTALGEYKSARNCLRQAQAIHQKIDDEQGLAADLQQLARIHLAEEDYVKARDCAGQALEIYQHSQNKPETALTWLVLALALEGLTHTTQASHAYEEAQTIAAEIGLHLGGLDTRAGKARCLLREGHPAAAASEIKAGLAELTNENTIWQVQYPVQFYLTAAEVLEAAGHRDEAQPSCNRAPFLEQSAKQLRNPQFQTLFWKMSPTTGPC